MGWTNTEHGTLYLDNDDFNIDPKSMLPVEEQKEESVTHDTSAQGNTAASPSLVEIKVGTRVFSGLLKEFSVFEDVLEGTTCIKLKIGS